LASGTGGEKAKIMQDEWYDTPLHSAVENRHFSLDIIPILASGPGGEQAKSMKDKFGKTPLELAAKKTNITPEIMNLLKPLALVETASNVDDS